MRRVYYDGIIIKQKNIKNEKSSKKDGVNKEIGLKNIRKKKIEIYSIREK